MPPQQYSLADVLSIAQIHPFYRADIQYPPDADAIHHVLSSATKPQGSDILIQPLLEKKSIYQAVERLVQDTSLENTYRRSSYLSITGGGSGGQPMLFAVDVHENRQQRLEMGRFLRLCRIVEPEDWVMSTHASGGFYRSLDLMTEVIENAGATVLSAGNYMSQQDLIQALIHFHVTVLTGDGSQVVQLVHSISNLPPDERGRLALRKIIYTSEPLTRPQRTLIHNTLPHATIYSVLGSAEAGPWAIGNPDLTGHDEDGTEASFIFDTRNMHIEILPLSLMDNPSPSQLPVPLPLGTPGIIVQTSLQRLRNPLVRYITGDVGSLEPLPDLTASFIPDTERQHLRMLRMRGRDRRFSFKWYGVYIEFENLRKFMQTAEFAIVQWQVILDRLPESPQTTLEVRLLTAPPEDQKVVHEEKLSKAVGDFFLALPENKHLYRLVFVDRLGDFERSSTAGKVINFVDRVHHKDAVDMLNGQR
ncbi:uncharacterized protein KD926_004157 [Aspergillus affinis]|uniref:uncharacterized protein n=1 Tax=Aspergillus affinis TaxID=1070780 RepID=UPI0022FED12D|nr:uncharacterized protein KD926_004157 [Aspergillus affinis]KAI9046319.1 hypothetical protein KD926_004157 [Aspergillus affinis]